MTKDIHRSVRRFFANYDYKLHNVYMYAWECDFFAISTSGYAVEVEIKQSRSDFFADFKKKEKHDLYSNHKQGIKLEVIYHNHMLYGKETSSYVDENGRIQWPRGSSIDFINPADKLPNKFYYACPDGLIKPEEVPTYAGLIYSNGGHCWEVKKAPFLHKQKNDKKNEILSKYYHKHNNLYNEVLILSGELSRHLSDDGKAIFNNFINRFHFFKE